MTGSTGTDAAFDLDWAGNIGMLTMSPGSRAGTRAKENIQSQGVLSRKQRPAQGKEASNLGTDGTQVLREQSNIGHVQDLGSEWKHVKSQASALENNGRLQAAVDLLNESIKQYHQPSDEMLQYLSDLKYRLNAAGHLNKKAVRMAIHRPCAEACEASEMCTPSITGFNQALCFDSQNNHGTTGGTLHPNPPSVSSKTPQSMSTPVVLPRPEGSLTTSTLDTSSSDDHVGIGVRIHPEMRAETPVLQLMPSTEDVTVSTGPHEVTIKTSDLEMEDTEIDLSSSMQSSRMQEKDIQSSRVQSSKARRSSVRFSRVESVVVAQSSPTESDVSPTCHVVVDSQIQDAGHTPYSAAIQSHVTFADATVSVCQQTPGACSTQEGLFDSESSGEEGGARQRFRSLNAGATPRHCEQSHVKFSQCTPAVAPAESQVVALAAPENADVMGDLSADECRHLSMNAGCTPGASIPPPQQPTQAAQGKVEQVGMRTDEDQVAGALQLDATLRAPVAMDREGASMDAGSSDVAACLTFRSDALQATAAAATFCALGCSGTAGPVSATLARQDSTTTPAVRGEAAKPPGQLKCPAEQSGLKSVSTVGIASAPPACALFRTPAQSVTFPTSLLPDQSCTAGLSIMHGVPDHAFNTIQEKSFVTESPVTDCHSTPTLNDASHVSPSTGTPVAGGCLTAVGKREGTPAFGAVSGLHRQESISASDFSRTPALMSAGGSGTPVSGGCHTSSGKCEGTPAFGAVVSTQSNAAGGQPVLRSKAAVNEENGSPGDNMISPNWLQSDADGTSAPCADGHGGFGSPVDPCTLWSGFDAVQAVSEASTPSLARESTTSRSPGVSIIGGASTLSSQPRLVQPERSAASASPVAPMKSLTPSSTQPSQKGSTPNDIWAEAESQAGFFQTGPAMSPHPVSTPDTTCSQDTADLLRESPATDELLKESPDCAITSASHHRFVSSSPMSPPSPLEYDASVSPASPDAPGCASNQQAPVTTPVTELPVSPGAMAILVAASLAARSPLAGAQAGTAPVCTTPEPVTPVPRAEVGECKRRTPLRRELKGILSVPAAQQAAREALQSGVDMCYEKMRADHKQQQKLQSTDVVTPVRRSRRSLMQSKTLPQKLSESGWAYSPNPALQDRAFSKEEADLLLESMEQLNIKGK